MVGKRNSEESYDINTEKRIETFFGRSNLKNTDPTLKPPHYAEDYIFCPKCETGLGRLEGKVIPVIQNQIREISKNSNYKEDLSLLKIPYKKCLHLSNAHFRLFIYSLLWRMSLIYEMKHSKYIISSKKMDELRLCLSSNIDLSLSGIENNNANILNYDFQVITADSFINATRNIVYSEEIYSNPVVFYLNEFIVLFYENGYTINSNPKYQLPLKSINEFAEILNEVNSKPKIGFVTADHYDKFSGNGSPT